jgi:hypothetical protein
MITIQKVTSHVQSVPRQSPDIYWNTRSIFRMYSVMAIFKSSVVWGLFEYAELFIAQSLFDYPVLRFYIQHTALLQPWRSTKNYFFFPRLKSLITAYFLSTYLCHFSVSLFSINLPRIFPVDFLHIYCRYKTTATRTIALRSLRVFSTSKSV